MTPQERAEKLFATCFTKEELEFLKHQPAFIDLSRKILTLDDAFEAVETGERLIHDTWNAESHKDSKFTPKAL